MVQLLPTQHGGEFAVQPRSLSSVLPEVDARALWQCIGPSDIVVSLPFPHLSSKQLFGVPAESGMPTSGGEEGSVDAEIQQGIKGDIDLIPGECHGSVGGDGESARIYLDRS